MVAVTSTMQALGSSAPDFALPDVTADNTVCRLVDYADKPLLIMFICNHCPYVVYVMRELAVLSNRARRDGYGVLAISSNDAHDYPQDGPAAMMIFASQYGFEFPYLYDESQQVARAYGAACTPDFYVYDKSHKLRYRGQMDSSRPNNGKPVTGENLTAALGAVLTVDAVDSQQIPSMGCNIKWRRGNEPDYF